MITGTFKYHTNLPFIPENMLSQWFKKNLTHPLHWRRHFLLHAGNLYVGSATQTHMYTHTYRHVWTRCPIDNLHWPCFWLSYKQIFFDYVTVCCITQTRMTNQVWQSNASWFCTDSAGVMKPPLFRHSSLWRRGPVTHLNETVVPQTTSQSQVAALPYREKLQLQFLSADVEIKL